MLAVTGDPSSDLALVFVAVCGAIPATIAAVASLRSARRATEARTEARAANAAVNNRPAGEPALYDLAREAASQAKDACRRVAELERLPAQLEQVAAVARKASRTAETNNELVTEPVAEHRELLEFHRRRWDEDEAGRSGTVERRQRRPFLPWR